MDAIVPPIPAKRVALAVSLFFGLRYLVGVESRHHVAIGLRNSLAKAQLGLFVVELGLLQGDLTLLHIGLSASATEDRDVDRDACRFRRGIVPTVDTVAIEGEDPHADVGVGRDAGQVVAFGHLDALLGDAYVVVAHPQVGQVFQS